MRVALTSPCLAPLPLCARVTRRNRLATLKCRASYSKKTERKVELPGTALPKDPTPPAEPSTANTEAAQASTSSSSENAQPSGTTEVTQATTDAEIQQLAQKYRELRANAAKDDNLMQGVLQEIGLIEWPTLQTALFNTALVISMVVVTSITLFGMNTVLAEMARVYYGAGGIKETIGSLFS